MCGFLAHFRFEDPIAESEFIAKLSMLDHRGPDHSGISVPRSTSHTQVLLGHTRLSIIDLTQNGRQPFVSDCGFIHMVYNGEIYNYIEIREELVNLGVSFNTDTDTEVFLKAFVTWGHDCYKKFVGMFSAIIFNEISNDVVLVRDAFGIKPIYYFVENKSLYVASEVAPILESVDYPIRANSRAVYQYLIHGIYENSSETFFDGVSTLPPASYIAISLIDLEHITPTIWWAPEIKTCFTGTYEEAKNRLRELFLKSLHFHLRSDVPLGLTLSGGIDSSAILWGIKEIGKLKDLYSFSYIANDKKFSEENWIDIAIKGADINNFKVSVNHKAFSDEISALIKAQGEPFSSVGGYAEYAVYKEMRKKGVVVGLNGQGADELLGGYEGHPGEKVMSLIESGSLLSTIKFIFSWSYINKKSPVLPIFFALKTILPDSVWRLVRWLTGRSSAPNWLNFEKVPYFTKDLARQTEPRVSRERKYRGIRVKERMKWSLTNFSLPALLRHGDRNSMAHSVEGRVPFLTIELFDFVYSLPEEYLVTSSARTKSIFRDSMVGILPDKIIHRHDKVGFDPGLKSWKEIYLKIILENQFKSEISKIIVLKNLEHLSEKKLWRVLNFLIWAEQIWGDGANNSMAKKMLAFH